VLKIGKLRFNAYGTVRKPILLNNGLNVVVGEKKDGEENSIGKTTFLLIIDFCFGGNSYRSTDVAKALGAHKIFFTFTFDKDYYYCRSTAKEDELYRCDDNKKCLENMSLAFFKKWLLEKYCLQDVSSSIREIVSPYFRVFNKSLLEANDFLLGHKGESKKEQIRNLQRLFDGFSSIKDIVREIDSYTAKTNLLSTAKRKNIELQELQQMESIQEIKKRLEILRSKEHELLENKSKNIENLSSQNTKKIIQLKTELKELRSKRSCLQMKLRNITIPENTQLSEVNNPYEALLEFFPTANIQLFNDIENFHKRFSESLKSDLQEFSSQIKEELAFVNKQVKLKETELSTFEDYGDITIPFLKEYSSIQLEIAECCKKIELHEKNSVKSDYIKRKKKELRPLEQNLMTNIQCSLNSVLKDFSNNVFGQDYPIVSIKFPTSSSAVLDLNLDDGTGTKYSGEILFDLAMLKITKLPAIIHDSFWLSNIKGARIEKIFTLYNEFKQKQIFISIDEVEKYGQEIQQILNDREILSLEPNGGELFGRSFPKEECKKKSAKVF